MSLLEYIISLSTCAAIYYCHCWPFKVARNCAMQAKTEKHWQIPKKNPITLIIDSLSNEDHQSIFFSLLCLLLFNAFIIVYFHLCVSVV